VDLFEFLLVFFIVVVPIFGVTARLAIAPMVEAIIRLRESFTGAAGSALAERRIAELEAEVRQLRTVVDALEEAEMFHRQLLSSPEDKLQE
jgi:hypothetical protein